MRRDNAYLLDILIAARKALKFLEGMTWEEFERSDLHQSAVMPRLIALIEPLVPPEGEA